MRAGIRRERRGCRKLERDTEGLGEEAGVLKGEKFDFFGGRQNLRSFLFLLLGFFDRVAHRAGMAAVEGFFSADKDRAVQRGVGPNHVRPCHGLKNSPVAADDEKQCYGCHDLAAGCEDFSTEREHESKG